jgi:hypothetical protein
MNNTEKMPTAKDFYLQKVFPRSFFESRDSIELDYKTDSSKQEAIDIMIEFAKIHVEAALKEASEKFDHYSNKNVILKSYPLNNIK